MVSFWHALFTFLGCTLRLLVAARSHAPWLMRLRTLTFLLDVLPLQCCVML